MSAVLVVEDYPGTRETLADILRAAELFVIAVSTMEEALEAYATFEFDAFLLDRRVGSSHSDEWLSRLPSPPAAVMVSGDDIQILRSVQVHSHGRIFAVRSKPVDPSALVDLIRSAISATGRYRAVVEQHRGPRLGEKGSPGSVFRFLTSTERRRLCEDSLKDWSAFRDLMRDSGRASDRFMEQLARTAEVTQAGKSMMETSMRTMERIVANRATVRRANRTISRQAPQMQPAVSSADGIAMVISTHAREQRRLRDVCERCVDCVMEAGDLGTSVGLAISTQPDLAVIDFDSDLGTGAALVLSLPVFAPRTRVLVLTDDPDAAMGMRTAGYSIATSNISESDLDDWIARVAS
ncbi:MAG TPA: hypothetical protein VKR22_04380 [Acidimicrobiales bacterium]|nr:hypothetical protein [Acidimicrobiales bacterium]